MIGPAGLRILWLNTKRTVNAPMNVGKVVFPATTRVTSMQMVDSFGRPTYRKDIHV
jgi:hypothetical protein